jgi:hypothetical protein
MMNRERIARELLKVARELVSFNKRYLVLVSDLSDNTAYFIDNPNHAKDSTDKSAVKSALHHNDTVTMGRVIVTPYSIFGSKQRSLLMKYGVGVTFDI